MAVTEWCKLSRVFCIYKPPLVSLQSLKRTVIGNIINDLNEESATSKENLVMLEGSTSSKLGVKVLPKVAIHPLAVGAGYVKEDIKMCFSNHLASTTSGVCVVGINKGVKIATVLKHSRLIKCYSLRGILGQATINLHHSGKVVERSTYSHVKLSHLEKILMTIQASHQKQAMHLLSENIESQASFEALSEEGLVRPSTNSLPLAYTLKCVEFNPPFFTIEVSCVNESEHFLRKIIHDAGLLLKTNATTIKVRCLRYGPFTVDDAIIRKHWRLSHITQNIERLGPRLLKFKAKQLSLKPLESRDL